MTAAGSSPMRPWFLVLAYLAFLGFIPLLLEPHDPEVRWHARNGLWLFGTVLAAGMAATFIGIAVPSLTCLYVVAMVIASLAYVMIAILAIVKALEGQRLIIPGISSHAGPSDPD
jgi:uncharacterized membrane protein